MLHRCIAIASFGLLVVLTVTGIASAEEGVPEVDSGSMTSAMALLAAGGLFVADRIRRVVGNR